MTKTAQLNMVKLKGHVRADQITPENIEDFVEALNGTLVDGILSFEIHKWTHRAIVGDWVVVYLPSGDVQTFSDAMFKRIFETQDVVDHG